MFFENEKTERLSIIGALEFAVCIAWMHAAQYEHKAERMGRGGGRRRIARAREGGVYKYSLFKKGEIGCQMQRARGKEAMSPTHSISFSDKPSWSRYQLSA